jgi:hypothetical protein
MDVGVDREGGVAEGKEQDDGGGLRAHALEPQEPVPGLLPGESAEELEVEPPALGRDRLKDGLDARGLLIGQTGGAQDGGHVFGGGVADGLPGGKPRTQGIEGPIPIEVIGVLREDGGDELVERRKGVAPNGLTVEPEKPAMDQASQARGGVHTGIVAGAGRGTKGSRAASV